MMMKKILFVLIVSLCCMHTAQAIKVKFTVDMTGTPVMATGVHVIGDFQSIGGYGADFIPDASCLMTQEMADTNLYSTVLTIPAFAKYTYKYCNGDQTYEVEIVPELSQVGYNFNDNRWIYIDSLSGVDTFKMPALVFNTNAPKGLNAIRFKVDMTLQSTSMAGVHLAGTFQSNDPSTHYMYSFQNNLHEIMAYMPLGSYDYKYYNGNTAADAESITGACATNGNRSIALSSDTALSVCYATCTSCYPAAIVNVDAQQMALYPNPMSQTTQLEFGNELPSQVCLFDLYGRQVQLYKPTQQHMTIHRQELPSGMYTLRALYDNGNFKTQKLIID